MKEAMILQLSRPTARLEVVATSSNLDTLLSIPERGLAEIVKDRALLVQVSATNK